MPQSNPDSDASPALQAPRSISPSAALAGISLLVSLFTGLASTAYAVWGQRLDLVPEPVTGSAFLEGRTTQGIANALAHVPQAQVAANLERGASWLLLHDLGPQVREGCRDWLFLAEELLPHQDAEANLQRRAEVVAQVHAALARRGIGLLVAVVPDKSRIEQPHLCGLHRPAALNGRILTWVTRLQAAHIPVVDFSVPLGAMQNRGDVPFYRTDTHWTEAGAQVSAHAIAQAVRALGIEPVPHQEYDITQSPLARRPGDLIRLAGIDWLPLALQPTPEESQSTSFSPHATPATSSVATENDLFGDASLPTVALIGTSFSRTSNFAGFLAYELQTPVANFGRDGGNFSGAASAYFAGPAFRQTPPRLVIWEIPERTLQQPTQTEADGWATLPRS